MRDKLTEPSTHRYASDWGIVSGRSRLAIVHQRLDSPRRFTQLPHGPLGDVPVGDFAGPSVYDQPPGQAPRQQQVVLGHRDETIVHAGIVLAGVNFGPSDSDDVHRLLRRSAPIHTPNSRSRSPLNRCSSIPVLYSLRFHRNSNALAEHRATDKQREGRLHTLRATHEELASERDRLMAERDRFATELK